MTDAIDRALCCGLTCGRATDAAGPCVAGTYGAAIRQRLEAARYIILSLTDHDRRIPHLLAVPAAVHFLSCEPLLGPVEFEDWWFRAPAECESCDGDGLGGRSLQWCQRGACPHDEGIGRIDWVIAGGESGPGARPMHPEWARSLRDQCAGAGVAFHFKQHGEWIGEPDLRRLPGGSGPGFGAFDHCEHDMDAEAIRVGKARAGRLLDGIEHNGMPEHD